jgi:hypothetical protein
VKIQCGDVAREEVIVQGGDLAWRRKRSVLGHQPFMHRVDVPYWLTHGRRPFALWFRLIGRQPASFAAASSGAEG